MVDQRRFNNQRSHRPKRTAKPAAGVTVATGLAAAATSDGTWVSARVAAAFLNIDIRTLYAYVSRGAVRSAPAPTGRSRQYLQQDLAKLKTRHDARAGHGAVAAAALRWAATLACEAISCILAFRSCVAAFIWAIALVVLPC